MLPTNCEARSCSFFPNTPELERKPGEFAGGVQGEPSPSHHLGPQRRIPRDFVVDVAGVEGDLPGRHGERLQGDAGQMRADDVVDVLGRRQLALGHEAALQDVARHVGGNGQHQGAEGGQHGGIHHGKTQAMPLVFEGNELGAADQHFVEELLHVGHHGFDAVVQPGVLVGRVFLGAARVGTDEGGEFAGQGDEGRIEFGRRGFDDALQMREVGLVAVEDLQQQVVRDFGRFGGLAVAAGQAVRQGRRAQADQAQCFAQPVLEQGVRPVGVDRRDVDVVVERDAAVRPQCRDPRQRQADPAVGQFLLWEKAQAQRGKLDELGPLADGVGIAQFVVVGGIARKGIGRVIEAGLFAIGNPDGDGEVDFLFEMFRLDGERPGRRRAAGNVETRAIREHAGSALQDQFAEGQCLAVDAEMAEAPEEGRQRRTALVCVVFEVAFLLLEQLRAQEQALVPDDFVMPAHGASAERELGSACSFPDFGDRDAPFFEPDVEVGLVGRDQGPVPGGFRRVLQAVHRPPDGFAQIPVAGQHADRDRCLVGLAFDDTAFPRAQEVAFLFQEIGADDGCVLVVEAEIVRLLEGLA